KQFAELYTHWCRQLAPRGDLEVLPDYISVDESRLYAGTPPSTPLPQQQAPTTDGQVVTQFTMPPPAPPEQSTTSDANGRFASEERVETIRRSTENLQQTADNVRGCRSCLALVSYGLL